MHVSTAQSKRFRCLFASLRLREKENSSLLNFSEVGEPNAVPIIISKHTDQMSVMGYHLLIT